MLRVNAPLCLLLFNLELQVRGNPKAAILLIRAIFPCSFKNVYHHTESSAKHGMIIGSWLLTHGAVNQFLL